MAHANDKEQIEMLGKWWRDYGRGILVAVILGLLIGLGWKYWHQRKLTHQTQASKSYMLMLQYAVTKNSGAMKAQLASIKKDYGNSPYAVLSSMLMAQSDVNQGKLKAALKNLQWASDHSSNKSFQQIAELSIARILVSQKQYANALKALSKVKDKSFTPMALTVKGDIYQAEGHAAQARKTYLQAQKAYQAINLQDPFLQMKLAS